MSQGPACFQFRRRDCVAIGPRSHTDPAQGFNRGRGGRPGAALRGVGARARALLGPPPPATMETMPTAVSAVSPARRVAAIVLRRVEEEGAYADRALAGGASRARLDAREHGFATALAFGAVQRRRTLDHVIERLARRPVDRLDPAVRDALRL